MLSSRAKLMKDLDTVDITMAALTARRPSVTPGETGSKSTWSSSHVTGSTGIGNSGTLRDLGQDPSRSTNARVVVIEESFAEDPQLDIAREVVERGHIGARKSVVASEESLLFGCWGCWGCWGRRVAGEGPDVVVLAAARILTFAQTSTHVRSEGRSEGTAVVAFLCCSLTTGMSFRINKNC